MTTRDDRFAQTMAALAVAMRFELDDPTIELYDRALNDVPIDLLEAASIELAKTSKFFPRPAEWREAVDVILDRQQRMLPPATQLQLPGDVNPNEWRCPECDGTGWVESQRECARYPCRPQSTEPGSIHTHKGVARCANTFCIQRRQTAAAQKRRYGKAED